MGALILCLLTVWCVGCSDDNSTARPSARMAIFSDVHFTPFYDPDLFPELVAAPADQWPEIFSRSSITEPPSWGKETNYPLLAKMLASLQESAEGSPLVLFPGDILAHHFRETFFNLYGEEDEEALRSFVYKTCAFFAAQVRKSLAGIPVLFVLGNNDSYAGDYLLVPEGEYLADTADLFYSTLLLGKADWTSFNATYTAGGYYQARPYRSNVLYICLNTVLFSVNWSSKGHEDAPTRQLNWLEQTLFDAKTKGEKVWILMHVPPGADVYGTISAYMDETGRITDALMMWKAEYQQRFLKMIRQYGDIVEVCFAGHTHMDEYRMMLYEKGTSAEPILMTPGVSPQYGNNPGYKVFAVSSTDGTLQDYRSVVYSFVSDSQSFETYYRFSAAYGFVGPLNTALATLVPELVSDEAERANYTHFYYSGHDGGNPINPTNWPAYWCAIRSMEKDDYIACVNSYQ